MKTSKSLKMSFVDTITTVVAERKNDVIEELVRRYLCEAEKGGNSSGKKDCYLLPRKCLGKSLEMR